MELLIVLSAVSIIASLIASVGSLAWWLAKRFTIIDKKFEEIDRRFEEVNKRFEGVDKRFEEIDRRFEMVYERFKEMDRRLEELRREMSEKIDELREEVRDDVRRATRALASYTRTVFQTLVDFMALKGLFTRDEREFLVREVERVGALYALSANPLKPEEAKFILEVAREIRTKDPKEIDLSKLDKIMEIAERWLWEDGSPDAAKLMNAAYILKRILQKERGEL